MHAFEEKLYISIFYIKKLEQFLTEYQRNHHEWDDFMNQSNGKIFYKIRKRIFYYFDWIMNNKHMWSLFVHNFILWELL